jgi:protocatechuate 3,4-dioxygenase beta subunit
MTEATKTRGRRSLLRFGAFAFAAGIFPRCGGTGTDTSSTSSGSTSDAGASTDGGTSAAGWATGGTAAMTAKASYPDPFVTAAACALSCEMTQGPCYDSASTVRQDISDGQNGLPMRMALRILDSSCNPVPGASIDVWHTSAAGKYSGDDTANEDVAFCTGNDSDYTSHLYFRGRQTTDASGKAYFDSCFPGWYSSRTIHVHLTIRVGGTAYLTTQLFFTDDLDNSIIGTEPLYDARGYIFETAQMTDGAMLAWKTIILRTATQSSCTP